MFRLSLLFAALVAVLSSAAITNDAGFTTQPSSAVQTLFRSIENARHDWRDFAYDVLNEDVVTRMIPVGDFYGGSGLYESLVGPHQAHSGVSVFKNLVKLHEIWNVQVDNRVEFLIALEGDLDPKWPTADGIYRKNITYHGSASLDAQGKISHLYIILLNMNEIIVSKARDDPSKEGQWKEELKEVICTNERKRLPWYMRTFWWKSACTNDLSYLTKRVGDFGAIGREDSIVCRAWYSTMMATNKNKYKSIMKDDTPFCQMDHYDDQWTNVADFYGGDTSVQLIPARDTFPAVFNPFPSELSTCDASCRSTLENTIKLLYSHTLWPTSSQVVITGSPVDIEYTKLFSPSSKGRITPPGTFDDLELNKEYFAGLVSAEESKASKGYILMNKATENFQVIAHYIIELDAQPATDITPFARPATNLSELIVFQFDRFGQILSYDGSLSELESSVSSEAYLRRGFDLGLFLEDVINALTRDFQQSTVIGQICEVQSLVCQGPLQEYASKEECINVLTNQRPFGSWDDSMRKDNVVCRLLHLLLIPYRPDVHCPHVGPSGGQICINKPQAKWHDWKWDAAGSVSVLPSEAAQPVYGVPATTDTGAAAGGLGAGPAAVLGAVGGALGMVALFALVTIARRRSKSTEGSKVGNARAMSINENFVYHRRSSSKENLVVSPASITEGADVEKQVAVTATD